MDPGRPSGSLPHPPERVAAAVTPAVARTGRRAAGGFLVALALLASALAVAPAPAWAQTVSLGLSSTSISEGGGVATVTASLTSAASAAVTVTVSVTPVASTGARAGDYTLTGTTLTIAASATASTGTVTITAVNNDIDAPDKRVRVKGSATGGSSLTGPADVTLTIADNEPSVSATTWRNGAPTANTWNVTTSSLLAKTTAQPLAVTSRPNTRADFWACATRTVAQQTQGYTSTGPNTSICTKLTDSSTPTSITLTQRMIDNDGVVIVLVQELSGQRPYFYLYAEWVPIVALPKATLALSSSSIPENGGVATVTATLDKPASGAATVTVAASPGAGTDFTLSATTALVFADGATASTGTVTITAMDDNADAPNAQVTISGTIGGDVRPPDPTTLTLIDDEGTPMLALALSPSSISETGGVATVTATLSGASSAPVTVTVQAAPGTGATARDFTLSLARTLTIAANATASTGTVTITAVNNDMRTASKQVTVSGSAAGGGVANPASVTLTVTDNDGTLPTGLDRRWGQGWRGWDVTTTSLLGKTAPQTIAMTAPPLENVSQRQIWACARRTVRPGAGSTHPAPTEGATCSQATGNGWSRTIRLTQAMIDNDGVVVFVINTARGRNDVTNYFYAEWLPITALPKAALALTSSAISETGGVATVTATLDEAASGAATVTVTVTPGAGAMASDVTLSGTTELVFASGATTSTGTVTITAVGNDIDSPDKRMLVSGQAAGDVRAPAAVALTLTDDDDLPTVALALSSDSISENGGVTSVTATLSGASSEEVVVTVTAADDFSLSGGGTLTIAAGATSSGAVTLTANDNDTDAPDKEVTVSATAAGGNGVASPTGVALTLTDDETLPTVALSLSPSSISETGGVASVTATLSGKSSEAVTVTVGAAAGTGAVAADFGLSAEKTLTIAAGVTASSGDVTITANGNDVDSPDKSVTVSGIVTGGNNVAAPSNLTLTLTDDEDLPTVALSLSPSSISETGGVASVTATLSGKSSEAVTVTVGAVPGTGAVAADFGLSAEKTLTIAAGATASSGDVTVTANGNDVDSPDKSVTVSGTVAGGNNVVAPSSLTLTLTDDETLPTVALALSPSSISETGGVASVTATLSGKSSEAVTVTVDAAAGTGAVAADFDLSAAKTLTIAAGATASSGDVTVTANGNDVDSPDKSVTVSGTVTGGNNVAAPSNVTLTLTDDETLPTVALALSPTSISETGGVASVTATLSGKSSEAVTVTVGAVPGTGAVAADFGLSAEKTLTIAAGATASSGDVTITANGNDVDSPDKSVTVSGMVAGGNNVAAPSNVTLTLSDDETLPTLTLALSSSSVSETGGKTTVTATLSGKSSEAVTVTVGAAAGTGAVAADFTLSTAKTLTFAVGATTSAGTVTVTANGNLVDTNDKTVTVSATVAGGNNVAVPSNLTLTLTDDDTAGVTFTPSTMTLTEEGAGKKFTMVLDTEPPGPGFVSVGLYPDAGLRLENSPLRVFPNGLTYTFAVSSWSTPQTVTLDALADADHQDNTLRLRYVVADYGLGDVGRNVAHAQRPVAVTVTVEDDDRPVVTLALSSSSISETGGVATVTATLDKAASQGTTVTVEAAAGTGAAAADFGLSAAKTLTIAAGSTASTGVVTVTANGNDVHSGDKSVTVSATVDGGDGASDPDDVTLTLADDETLPTVTLSLSDASIAENGGETTVTATLSGKSSEAVTVTVGAAAGTGAAAADFDLSAAKTLTIAAGATDSAGTVTVTANGNDVHSGNKSVTVSGMVAGGNNVAAPSDVTLTLTDDETLPTLTLALSSSSISETGGVTTVTATLSGKSSEAVTVTVAASPGTGAVAADFTLTGTKLTIAAGATASAGTVTVTANGNDVYSGNKSVTVSGTATGGNNVAKPSDVTLTLTDDETLPTVTLALSDPVSGQSDTIKELATAPPAERMTTVTATLGIPASAAVTITVSATAGTNAVAGNYTLSTAKTLTIAAGVTTSTGTVTITAVDDRIDSIVDDTVAGKKVVVKGAPSGTLALAAPADVELLIWEDDRAALVTAPAFPRCRRAPCPVWLSVAEGASDTFTVKLNSEPTTNIAVAVKSDESDEGLVSSGGTAAASTRLTFTATNWETAQTVTLHGVVDNVVDGDDDYTLRLFPDTPDTPTDAYHVIGGASVRPQTVRTTDVDVAGLTVSESTLTVTEGGTEQTFTVKLTSKPAAAVTVTATSGDGDEVRLARSAGDADARAFAASKELVFTANDWNDVQTLRVAAVDDDRDDPASLPVAITLDTASGGDSHYNGLDDETVDVTKNDDDATPTVTLARSPAAISETGGVATVTATLSDKSDDAVTVTVAASPGTGAVAADFALSTAKTLTIAAGSTASAGTVTVRANGNDVDSPDKQVTISGTVAGGHGLLSSPSDVTLTLTDDETLPTVTLALSDGSISEQAGETTVTATLSGKSSQAVTVTVAASPGTGAVAADFDLSAAKTLTIAAGATASAGVVTVTANGNDVDAPNKSVTVSATVVGGNGVAAPSDVTLTLTDDETLPTVTLALSDGSISEQGGETTVTATLSGKSSQAVTVTVGAAPGAGAVAADFDLSPAKTLTIAAGSTTSAGTVTVTANGNDVHSGNKSVTISGTAVGGNGVANPDNETLTLTDDETLPTVTLALSPTSISETGGVSSVTATLSGKSSEAVVVTVAAVAGTGAVAADFDLSTAKTLTIAAGSTTSAGAVTVTANGNTVDSPDKSVTVSGTVAGGNGVAAPSNVTLTLTDDDALPTATLLLSAASIDESGASNVTTVTARLDHGSSEPVTITVSLSPVGSTGAVAGDYTLSSPSTLTIAAGGTESSGVVTVTAVDNNADEPDIQVTVSGAATGGRGVADPATKTLTIRDDEGPPLVTLLLSSGTIDESGASNVTTVTASLNRTSSAVTTVTVSASPGAGTDFTQTGTTLTIAANGTASSGTVTVTAEDDDTDAPNKSVTISGTAVNTQGITQPSTRTLTIRDDDAAPDATLTVASPSIPEDGGSTTVNATLSRPSSAATTVTVTAQAGVYTVAAGAGATIVFTAGQTANAADTATVTAVNNAVDAPDNAATVTGAMTNSQGTGSVTGASLTITDDDTAGFAVSPTTSTSSRLQTTEAGGTDTFTVALTSEPAGNVELDLASSDPSEGAVSPSSLTFTSTNWSTAQTVTLTGQDDSIADGSQDYTVTLTVDQANTADAIYDALSVVTVYAENADDEYGLVVGAVTGQATEAGGQASFTVALRTQPAQAVTVAVTSRDSSEGRVSPSTLTFQPGNWSTTQVVTVTGQDDDVDDGTVTWQVRLDPASGDANYNALANVDVSLTTTDNDGPPAVTLALSPSSIDESGTANTAAVRATLSRASSAATTVTVTAVSGFYTVGSDATIVIPAGDTAAASDTAAITAVNNTTDAPDRTVTVTATVANDRASADSETMAVTGATLTIRDDDAAPNATLSLNPASITENGGTSAVSATLSHRSSEATTVTVTAVSGFYTVGSDATIVIAAGDTAAASDTAAIAAVDNDVDEPNRMATVTATLGNGQGAGSVTGATLTLTDDEATPMVTLSVMPSSISENGATATVRATLSGRSSEPTTVTVTAQANVYSVASGAGATIIVAAGQTTTTDTATITAVDNAVDAADNMVTVTGTAANGHGVTATATGASLTLTDDDVAAIVTSPQTSATSRVRTSEDGSTATVDVTLATEPTGDVVIDVASSDTAQGTVSPAMLTFTSTNWNTAQTVTLTGVDDSPGAADGSQTYTLSLTVNQMSTADANYDALSAVTLHAVNADDELGLDVGTVSGPVTEAGGTATFTVRLVTDPALATQASQAVTVSVSSRDTGEGRVSPPSLAFTAGALGTWNVNQTVTVTGVDDNVDDGDVIWNVRLDTSSATGSDYDGVPDEDVAVTTTDDDAAPEVTLSVSPGSISENGGTATVRAALSRASDEATTVTVTGVSGLYTPGSDATIVIAAGATTSTDTATVEAVDDAIHQGAAGRETTVTATVANDRAAADATTMAVTGAALALTDDEAPPGATLSLNPATVDERGAGNTSAVSATLSRTSAVATTVTVTAVPGAYTVGSDATIVIPAGVTTAASDTATITAVDNDVDEPNRTPTVTATLSNDRGAGSVTGATLTITDDDAAPTVALSVMPGSISEDGGTAAVGAVLSNPSSQPTTVTVTAVANAYSVAPGAGGTIVVAAGQTTTTTTDTATITAVNNDVDAADNVVTVTGTPTNGQGVGALTDASLTITDDDVAGIVLSAGATATARVRTSEDGSTATVDVTLATEPTGDVVIDVASQDTAQGTVSPAMLTFTAGNWNTAQTVTLTGVDDDPGTPDGSQNYTVTLTVDAANTADANYDALSAATIHARNLDDEAGVEVSIASGTTLMTTEGGGTATFTVRLLSAPEGDVTVPLVSSDPGEGTVSPSSLVFTATNATTAQTVVVTGVDDEVDDGDEPYRIETRDPSSPDDDAYDGLGAGDVADVLVVNADDDATPAVTLSLNPTSIAESGGVATVTAVLSHPSDEATTVTVEATAVAPAEAGDFTLSTEATLTVAALATASTGTVTVAAVDNAVDAPDAEVRVSGTAANDRASADSIPMTVTGATLTIADDDEKGLALARAGVPEFAEEPVLDVDAGAGGVSYTVALTSEPTGAVTVEIGGDNEDVSASPERLAFTAADWQEGQTVTVRAVADDDEEADAAVVLVHVAGGGGYDGVTKAVTVAVAEAGDTVAALEPGKEETYRVVGSRRIVVETAAASDAEDEAAYRAAVEGFVLIRYEVVGDAPGGVLRLTVAPVSNEARTRMERGAFGWGEFGFGYSEQAGSAAGRMALDVEAEGMMLDFCLFITERIRDAAAGSALVLLHHDGSAGGVWTVVEGSGENDDGTHVCASGVKEFSDFAVGWKNKVPSWAGVELETLGPYVAGEWLPEDLGLPGLLPENVGDAPVRYELAGPEGAPLPAWLTFDKSGKDEEVEEGAGCPGEVERALCGRPPAEMDDTTLEFTLVAIDRHEDRTEPGLAVEIEIDEDLVPTFGGATVEAQVYTLEEAIEPLLLPEAGGGNGTLDYTLAPALPRGLVLDEEGTGACGAARTVCGTPAEVAVETVYTWSAEDRDGDETAPPVRFTIEVEEGKRKARARLRRLNESILPELSRASWDSAMEAVARRLEGPVGGGGSGAYSERLSAALAGFVQANEQALEESSVSWRELLIEESFAVALGGEGESAGTGLGRSATVWGAGDRRHLSRDEPSLEWSGDLFVFHLGADADFGSGVTGGLGMSWFESLVGYVDRSDDEPVEGVHRSRMVSVQPYLGWSSGEGSRLWASVGYGEGEIEIEDEDLLERFGRQRSDSRLLAVAAGGAVRLTSDGATRVDVKGEAQATRYTVDENGDLIEGLTVETRRLRASAEGAREYVLAGGGRLTPSAEFGVRWDGGDGATGAGVEVGGGLSWTGPGRLVLEAGGRWLVAHRSELEEWGLSGGLRLTPRANGRGLSLSVAPGWGEAGSGMSRLWEEGLAGRGGLGEEDSGAGVKAEMGYGVGAFGGFGVATPYTRFEQAREGRRYGFGWRLDRRPGEAFALDLEAWRRERDTERPDHGLNLDLRLKW